MAENPAERTGNNIEASKAAFRESILRHAKLRQVAPWHKLSDWEKLFAVSLAVRERLADLFAASPENGSKRVYLLSMEYLSGRSLERHLVNLRMQDVCREVLATFGTDLDDLFEAEPEAGLGSGSIGQAATSFLESLTAAGFAGWGYGINYELGQFKQEIHLGQQTEMPNLWRLHGCPWQVACSGTAYRIPMGGRVESSKDAQGAFRPRWVDHTTVLGIPCDMFVSVPGGQTVSLLRLFSAAASDQFDAPVYEEADYPRALETKAASGLFSKVLYPLQDWASPPAFRLLQEYFLAACALRDILRVSAPEDLQQLPAKAAIHMNGTQSALTVAELMRILVDDRRVPWDAAWEITTQTLSCTNHAHSPDLSERWPVSMLEQYLPRHLQIIFEINQRFLREVLRLSPGDHERTRRMSMVEEGPGKRLRTAHLAIVGSHSVSHLGSALFDIAHQSLFSEFALLWPTRLNSKTPGVNPGRWLGVANQGLTELITEALGESWITNPERLARLESFVNDSSFRKRFLAVRQNNKRRLTARLLPGLHDESLLDVQIKEIHESKRQLLNLLRIVHDYLRVAEDGHTPATPKTVLFAGKATPGDFRGKEIIHLIHAIARTVESDERANRWLKVIFVPDFGVAAAEKIISAADLGEQISTASREPSGTCHLKLAMNGALTIGAPNGTVLELEDRIGGANLYRFGYSEEQTHQLEEEGVHPREFYSHSPVIRRILDVFLTDEFSPGDPGRFAWVYHFLVENWDRFHHLADLVSYIDAHNRIERDYSNRDDWARKAILNVARSAAFSSHTTVQEYARDVWDIQPRVRART